MQRPSAIWLYKSNTNSFQDLTQNINNNSNFDFISTSSDEIFIGSENRFTGFYSDLVTGGGYSGISYSYLSRGSAWKGLQLVDNYLFDKSKYQRWNLPKEIDWGRVGFSSAFPHANANPPDINERYWVKISASQVTSSAIVSKFRIFSYASYTTPDKVANFLQIKVKFDGTTKPTDLAVEDLIRRGEDLIDYRTKKSWRTNFITEETDPMLVDYNRYGVYLRHRNFIKIYSIQLWTGSAWQTLVEGKNSDFFVNYDLGMIYFTRMFTLPVVYGIAGRYYQYNMGEFKNSIKVDYIYGRDPEVDPEFYIVEDITTKLASRDILQHHDYSMLVSSGSDRVSLESKVRLLTEETDQKIDSLAGISLY